MEHTKEIYRNCASKGQAKKNVAPKPHKDVDTVSEREAVRGRERERAVFKFHLHPTNLAHGFYFSTIGLEDNGEPYGDVLFDVR